MKKKVEVYSSESSLFVRIAGQVAYLGRRANGQWNINYNTIGAKVAEKCGALAEFARSTMVPIHGYSAFSR